MAPVMGHEVGSLGEILAGCMYCVCKREGVGRERRKDTIIYTSMDVELGHHVSFYRRPSIIQTPLATLFFQTVRGVK